MGTSTSVPSSPPLDVSAIAVSSAWYHSIWIMCFLYQLGIMLTYFLHAIFYLDSWYYEVYHRVQIVQEFCSLYSGILFSLFACHGLVFLQSCWKWGCRFRIKSRSAPGTTQKLMVYLHECLQVAAITYHGYVASCFLRSSFAICLFVGILLVLFTVLKLLIWHLCERPRNMATDQVARRRLLGEIVSKCLDILIITISYISRHPHVISSVYSHNMYFAYQYLFSNDSIAPLCDLIQGLGILWCLVGIQNRIQKNQMRVVTTTVQTMPTVYQPVHMQSVIAPYWSGMVPPPETAYSVPPGHYWPPQTSPYSNPAMPYFPHVHNGMSMGGYPSYHPLPPSHNPYPSVTMLSSSVHTRSTPVFYGASMTNGPTPTPAPAGATLGYPNPAISPYSVPTNTATPGYFSDPLSKLSPGACTTAAGHVGLPNLTPPFVLPTGPTTGPTTASSAPSAPSDDTTFAIITATPNNESNPKRVTATQAPITNGNSYLLLVVRIICSLFSIGVIVMEVMRRGETSLTSEMQQAIPSLSSYLEFTNCDYVLARPPWFTFHSNVVSCSVVNLNCRNDQSLTQKHFTMIFNMLDSLIVRKIRIVNCQIPQIPHEILKFKALEQLEFHHVEIKQWPITEALTYHTHPSLLSMSFYHVQLPNNGTIPPGLSSYNFPLVTSLSFFHTPIRQFPPQIGKSWVYIENIMMENCNITLLPDYFFDTSSSEEYNYQTAYVSSYSYYYSIRKRTLSLVGNELTQVPYQMFHAPNLERIHLDMNPLTELPDSVLEMRLLTLSMTGTQLTTWPLNMNYSGLSYTITAPMGYSSTQEPTQYFSSYTEQPSYTQQEWTLSTWMSMWDQLAFVASNTPICDQRPSVFFMNPAQDQRLYDRICLQHNFTGYLDTF